MERTPCDAVTYASTLRLPPQRGHANTSSAKVRRSSPAQSSPGLRPFFAFSTLPAKGAVAAAGCVGSANASKRTLPSPGTKTPSGTSEWKCGVACSAEPKNWMNDTAPACPPRRPCRRALRRCRANTARKKTVRTSESSPASFSSTHRPLPCTGWERGLGRRVPQGDYAACPPAGSITRAAPSAALLGPSAPSLPLNWAPIPLMRKRGGLTASTPGSTLA